MLITFSILLYVILILLSFRSIFSLLLLLFWCFLCGCFLGFVFFSFYISIFANQPSWGYVHLHTHLYHKFKPYSIYAIFFCFALYFLVSTLVTANFLNIKPCSYYLLFVGKLFFNLYFYNLCKKNLIIYIFCHQGSIFLQYKHCFIAFKRHPNSLSLMVNEPSGEMYLTWV